MEKSKQILDCTNRYCVVGAGASGLTAAKNLKQLDIPFSVIEREAEIGGMWNYTNDNNSVYASTHLISSKPLTEYTDFPMPDDYPDYPNHRQVMEYFQSYAETFGLLPFIDFNTTVESIEQDGAFWVVALGNGQKRRYRGIIIANGHLAEPKSPEYPGEFKGEIIHSNEYKTSDILKGKKVLVVGAGNSGCDIAVESAQNAEKTFHSVRRGYHYVPKYLFGQPADQVGEVSLKLRLPLALRRFINGLILRLLYGQPEKFGLPKPDHKLFETHPIVNSQIFYYLGHGDITPKPDVYELCGNKILFVDDSEEEIDLVIFATGYKISFPFIDKKYLNYQNNHPGLLLNIFHPEYDNLFCAGLIQPDSGSWGLVDYQSQVIARFIKAKEQETSKAAAFRKQSEKMVNHLSGGIHYIQSSRHILEVEHFSYRQNLKKLIKMFD